MIITREKGMRMWGGGSGSTSASGVNGGGGFSLAVEEGEGTGNAYTGFTYESGVLSLIKGEKFVTVDFFNRLFTAYDSDGNAILPNDVTSTINNLKLLVGTWTEEYLSALGKNSEGGGGGGGIELSDVWQSLKTNTDDYANQKINSAHIPDLSGTYATKTWVNQQGFVTSSGVTSVAMTVPTGLSVSGSPITSTGTLALTFTSGYSIPTTAKQSNWDTAYGWGNHATAGYATASSVTTLQGYFTNGVAKTAAKLNTGTTTYSAWGQTYWSSGVPQSISGNMTSVGSITPSANGNALGTTSARFNIYGTAGNFSGNVSIGGTLGVTGATTLTGLLTANGGIVVPSAKTIKIGDCTISWDSTNSMLKFDTGIYSTGAVSALGSNSSGGGSGTFDEEAMWEALGTTSTAKVIATSHIPNLAASKITSGTFAAARIPSLSADKITSGTFAAARIPDLSGRYYALYGGTNLNPSSSNAVNLNNLLSVGSYYCASDVAAEYVSNKPITNNFAFRVWVSATIGTSGNYLRQRFQSRNQMAIFERVVGIGSGTVQPSDWGNWYLVQNDLANYASASSLNNYLPLSGGQMTGTLTWKNGTALPSTTSTGFVLCIDAFADGGTTHYIATSNLSVGSASTATTLATSRYIWGQSFNGSDDIPTTAVAKMPYVLFKNYNDDGNAGYCGRGSETNNNIGLLAYSGNQLRLGANGSTVMYISTSNNVGIGTSSPSSPLHVNGSGQGWTFHSYGYASSSSFSSFYASNGGGYGMWCGTSSTSSNIYVAAFYKGITSETGVGGSPVLYVRADGCIGFNTSSPSYACHVVGSVYATVEVTAASDARLKNILGDANLDLKYIADAPNILYEWKDKEQHDDNIHVGSLAQYWLKDERTKYLVSQDKNNGMYSLNYGALATSMAISIAKEVVKHEDRITLLEKENAKLKEKVAELEERRIA